jgi:hypothetical protein
VRDGTQIATGGRIAAPLDQGAGESDLDHRVDWLDSVLVLGGLLGVGLVKDADAVALNPGQALQLIPEASIVRVLVLRMRRLGRRASAADDLVEVQAVSFA